MHNNNNNNKKWFTSLFGYNTYEYGMIAWKKHVFRSWICLKYLYEWVLQMETEKSYLVSSA